MGVMQFLQVEARKGVDPRNERWQMFSATNPDRVGTGSLLQVTYRVSRTASTTTAFTGVLLAVRRSPGDPTILVRGIIDDVGVEQIFCLFSPLLERIDVLKASPSRTFKKLYSLREQPYEILKLKKTYEAKQAREEQTVTLVKKTHTKKYRV